MERSKIEEEYAALMKTIEELKAILGDRHLLLGVIKKELQEVADKYGDDRRTKFGFDPTDIGIEDMIPNEPAVITATQLGYIKRMTVDNFRSQNRGGKGIRGMQTIEEDEVAEVMMTKTHNFMLFFTNQGRAYRLKAYEIPEASRTARGTALVNLLQLQPEEHVTTVIPLNDVEDEDKYLFMATRQGIVKRTPLIAYKNLRKTGINAITLHDDDELIGVVYTEGKEDIFLVTRQGMSIRFDENDARPMGRTAAGVRGIKLRKGDAVVAMQVSAQGDALLTISENGLGKRTAIEEFNRQTRGGLGLKCYKVTEKTGELLGAKMVNEDSEMLLITTEGIMIRTPVNAISMLGRITSGVKVMDLAEGVTVASISKVHPEALSGAEDAKSEDDAEEAEEPVKETDETAVEETGEEA